VVCAEAAVTLSGWSEHTPVVIYQAKKSGSLWRTGPDVAVTILRMASLIDVEQQLRVAFL
jgi:hypothetical protein